MIQLIMEKIKLRRLARQRITDCYNIGKDGSDYSRWQLIEERTSMGGDAMPLFLLTSEGG